jgi:chaperone required for assembly of F1-ATPase
MPATRLAHTAIDAIAAERGSTAESVVRYARNDLLCYFAEGPAKLVRRQEKTWGPLLEWARDAHGLAFTRAVGIVHRPQPPETLVRLEALLAPLDDFTLTGMAFAAALFGSAILALALRDGRIGADEAMAAARLDEIFQEEQWGVDAEAAARADAMAVEAVMAERWFAALRDQLVTGPPDR